MKRIKFACLEQTLHFMIKDDVPHAEAVKMVRQEVESYKNSLEKKKILHRIESEQTQEDGSVIIMIRKQYNDHSCGEYLDR